MRENRMDSAYIFDALIASRMELIHRAMRLRLRALAEELHIPMKHLELILAIVSFNMDTAGGIAKQLGVSRSLLSKNIEEAVHAGYIETTPDAKDRRVVRLHLTPQAEIVAERCKEMRKTFHQEITEGIDPAALDTSMHVLRQMWENMERMTAQEENAACRKENR